MMIKTFYYCDTCQKKLLNHDRFERYGDKPKGWISFNGVVEFSTNFKIISGQHDFCSYVCFIKMLESNKEELLEEKKING